MSTTDDAALYASRHNHPYDPASPCLEQTAANNRSKRGQCLVQSALALATARQPVIAFDEEHFLGCPCGRCQTVRSQRAETARAAAQAAQHPCCQHTHQQATLVAA